MIVDQKKLKLDPAVLARLRRKIRNWRAEIVHGFLFDGDIYARIAAAGTGATVLNSERSDNYEISRTQKIAHWLTKGLVDGVVANSRSGSAFAQKLYGYRPEHMHVVWNGMRIDDFERKGQSAVNHREEFFGPAPVRIACMIGHIKPAKDYPLALETAAALLKLAPDWRVLFLGDSLGGAGTYQVGRDSDTSDYKRMVMDRYQALGLTSDKVKFAGARPDAPAILAQCDVQLMTSRWEGFPNVVLEGMVLGVPVVSTEYSDIKHILPRATQIVADRSPEALARAIADAHAHREAIAGEQKRWVRAHASIEIAARELESVYAKYIRTVPHAQAA